MTKKELESKLSYYQDQLKNVMNSKSQSPLKQERILLLGRKISDLHKEIQALPVEKIETI